MANMDKCQITLQPVKDFSRAKHLSYSVDFLGQEFNFRFCVKCYEKIDFKKYRSIICGLLLNDRLNLNEYVIHWDSKKSEEEEDAIDLKKEIETAIFPKSPKEKLENLFSNLYSQQKYDGETISLDEMKEKFLYYYFKSEEEFQLYISALEQLGYITIEESIAIGLPTTCQITYQGLNEYIKIFEEGYNSNSCFVAMSFSPETNTIRQAIKNALVKTGFIPILIDEANISSDKTINDEIIASLKKCKFCIADFTHHKNGVYFESGYALGQGKPVIYTCLDKEFANAHFDIKPLQHIIYSTPEELEQKLVNKIEAWIK